MLAYPTLPYPQLDHACNRRFTLITTTKATSYAARGRFPHVCAKLLALNLPQRYVAVATLDAPYSDFCIKRLIPHLKGRFEAKNIGENTLKEQGGKRSLLRSSRLAPKRPSSPQDKRHLSHSHGYKAAKVMVAQVAVAGIAGGLKGRKPPLDDAL